MHPPSWPGKAACANIPTAQHDESAGPATNSTVTVANMPSLIVLSLSHYCRSIRFTYVTEAYLDTCRESVKRIGFAVARGFSSYFPKR
jgi:hypothetical protein